VAVLLHKQGAEQTVAQDVSINRASDAQFSMISRTKRILEFLCSNSPDQQMQKPRSKACG